MGDTGGFGDHGVLDPRQTDAGLLVARQRGQEADKLIDACCVGCSHHQPQFNFRVKCLRISLNDRFILDLPVEKGVGFCDIGSCESSTDGVMVLGFRDD